MPDRALVDVVADTVRRALAKRQVAGPVSVDGLPYAAATAILTAMCEGPHFKVGVLRASVAFDNAPRNASDDESISAAIRAFLLGGSPE